ncbi:alpha/beta fold hydrolase [Mesorhizobium sp. CO1-1-8]|uniref:alpha/beta fold hydrolase n=1 Tax=Mesorhizobium sp. CO1-1-8 TaxID=2876631 RepID=UPI001CD0E7FC|nr:alpha/beta fold hydrolase [Mesorhizobium sp. CO1-1-8]MBZ9772542.1 alpha/beta fold hydrolase [Mesorhizobium sp. CO1-1-8]
MTDYQLFRLGDHPLDGGLVLPDATLAFKTYGQLNANRDNAVVVPTAYAGVLAENEPRIGLGLALDPSKYFIISVGLFGDGQSSSPSNMAAPHDGPRFPQVTIADNVRAQHRLVTRHLGVEKIQLVTGFSMGGLQTFEWAVAFPQMVDRIAPVCGAARCAPHNYVFVASLEATLRLDPMFENGEYAVPPQAGLRAFGRIYASWALSQAFYRERVYLDILGFASLDDYLERFWDGRFFDKDANDLLAMLRTWQTADISRKPAFAGDFKAALSSIGANALLIPSATDLYFPVDDNRMEADVMPSARCCPIPSVWGHMAGFPGTNQPDTNFVNAQLLGWLREATV